MNKLIVTGVPRCIRMDRGTENRLIEDIQISFRADHTDSMAGEKSVLYGSSVHNQVSIRQFKLLLNGFI